MIPPEKQARSTLAILLWSGLLIGIIGGVVMGATWPSTTVDAMGSLEESGSAAGFIVGVMVAWAGSMLLAISVVGYGVRLGREASPTT